MRDQRQQLLQRASYRVPGQQDVDDLYREELAKTLLPGEKLEAEMQYLASAMNSASVFTGESDGTTVECFRFGATTAIAAKAAPVTRK